MEENRRVVVIGAGLAGCATAEAFSRRGWQVLVLERHTQPGGAVRGLPLVAQHPALTPDHDLRSRLLIRAMRLHAWLRAGPAQDLQPAFERCGRFQPMAAQRAQRCLAHVDPSVARFVQQPQDGLWFPDCAAVSPARWWQQVLQRSGVQLRTGIRVARLARGCDGRWQLFDAGDRLLAESAQVVLACREQAFSLAGMTEADHGRLRLSPGRVWTARADDGPAGEDPGEPPLLPIIGGEGLRLERPGRFWLHNEQYHQRWLQGQAADTASALGEAAIPPCPQPPAPSSSPASCPSPASLPDRADRPAAAAGLVEADDSRQAIRDFIERPESWHAGAIGERLQLRDNLPMIGPAPDTTAVAAQAEALARNDRLPIPRQPGVHLLCGLAGRGTLYAAIGAEMIAAAVCNEPAVVDDALARATDPTRFIKRRLQRAWSQRPTGQPGPRQAPDPAQARPRHQAF